jgi:prophage regulatory protein
MTQMKTNKDELPKHWISNPPSPQTYLSDTNVSKKYGVSRSTVWRWAANDPTFPKPIKLGLGSTRWKLSDLETWEAGKAGA